MDIKYSFSIIFFNIDINNIEGLLVKPYNKPLNLFTNKIKARRFRVAKVWDK